MFNRHLATYRKITRENLNITVRSYGILREVLIAEALAPFQVPRCGMWRRQCARGDATAHRNRASPWDRFVSLLLDLARETLGRCPVRSIPIVANSAEALGYRAAPARSIRRPSETSLHHLQSSARRKAPADGGRPLGAAPSGVLLIPATQPPLRGEDWLHGSTGLLRSDRRWPPLSDDDPAVTETHTPAADLPEHDRIMERAWAFRPDLAMSRRSLRLGEPHRTCPSNSGMKRGADATSLSRLTSAFPQLSIDSNPTLGVTREVGHPLRTPESRCAWLWCSPFTPGFALDLGAFAVASTPSLKREIRFRDSRRKLNVDSGCPRRKDGPRQAAHPRRRGAAARRHHRRRNGSMPTRREQRLQIAPSHSLALPS